MVHSPNVQTGLDVLISRALAPLRNKRVGLITNPTGRTRDGRPVADVLMEAQEVELVALFGPEHGIWGIAVDGLRVENDIHPRYNIPIYSLYGKTEKPNTTP